MDGNRKRKKANHVPDQWQTAFLAALTQTGSVTIACSQAAVARQTAYRYRRADRAFAAAWDTALEDASDILEAEARRRAVLGVETKRLIVYKGEPVIDGSKPGEWVDERGQPWMEGASQGRKHWTGEYLYDVMTTYSDALLARLLKAAKPEKYGDRARVDTAAVQREARRLAEALNIPVEELLAEVRQLMAEETA